MIIVWMLIASAFALPPDAISNDRKQPTRVWLTADTPSVDSWVLRNCEVKLVENVLLPAGLPAHGHVQHDKCGGDWVFLDLHVETGAKAVKYAMVPLDSLSLTPPKHAAWEKLPDGPSMVVYGGRDDPEPSVPLDDPGWDEPYWLGSWEPVTVLDADAAIVRTEGGRVLQTSRRWLETAPKYLPQDKERFLGHLSYFQKGRVAREGSSKTPLRSVLGAEVLSVEHKSRSGQLFVFRLYPESLHSPQYAAEWMEPIGQIHERACTDRTDRWEGCGAYFLDYSAFGSWRPAKSIIVVGVVDGLKTVGDRQLPRLRVMVRDPFGDRIQVAPEWDR